MTLAALRPVYLFETGEGGGRKRGGREEVKEVVRGKAGRRGRERGERKKREEEEGGKE